MISNMTLVSLTYYCTDCHKSTHITMWEDEYEEMRITNHGKNLKEKAFIYRKCPHCMEAFDKSLLNETFGNPYQE